MAIGTVLSHPSLFGIGLLSVGFASRGALVRLPWSAARDVLGPAMLGVRVLVPSVLLAAACGPAVVSCLASAAAVCFASASAINFLMRASCEGSMF